MGGRCAHRSEGTLLETTTSTPGTPRYIDLSHELYDGMAPYPGLPLPRIGAHRDHEESRAHFDGEEFFLGKFDMPANVGTYIDAPFHRFRDRADLSQIPLSRLVGLPGVVVDCTDAAARELQANVDPEGLHGAAVLVRTGWDRRWGTDAYWEPGPYVAEGFADLLVESGVALLGVDFWNADDTTTRRRPVHTRLLDAGILIVEHLCQLGALPPSGFRFSAPVVRIRQGASFPVRAFAEVHA
jgi:arylformamidase